MTTDLETRVLVVEWIDPLTGEVSVAFREGWVEVDKPPEEGDEEEDDAEWLPDYFMTRVLTIHAKKAAIKAQTARLLKDLDSQEKALNWRYMERLEDVAWLKSVENKKKYADFTYGRVAFRKSSKTIVTDEAAAMRWAADNCPKAIKIETKTKLLRSELPKDESVPGIERETTTRCSVSYPTSTE
tara:strand:+ start:1530 stop:2084 length:555 start_codon:yes stop_codon:yes gene_type:complete